jgi:hypothetical protein
MDPQTAGHKNIVVESGTAAQEAGHWNICYRQVTRIANKRHKLCWNFKQFKGLGTE